MNWDNASISEELREEIEKDSRISERKSRYRAVRPWKGVTKKQVRYKNAEKASKEVSRQILEENLDVYCILSGNFIMGEFFEAFVIDNDLKNLEVSISTLSLDGAVLASLHNWHHRTNKMNLIASDYWYAHNRGMLKKVYEELDDGDTDFQFAIASTHTKDVLIKLEDGRKIVATGSANLRSSNCVEFLQITHNPELYDFLLEHHNMIIEKYYTINKGGNVKNRPKSLRKNTPWE